MPESVRQLVTALKCLLVLTVVLGIGYPLLVLGVGQLGLPRQAEGSLVTCRRPGRRLPADRSELRGRRVVPAAAVGR